MGTASYGCGCYITRSMFGEHEVLAVGHCWQHWGLYSQNKTPRQMAAEIREAPDHSWRERPSPHRVEGETERRADEVYCAPERHRAVMEIDAHILVALFKPGRRSYEVIENAIPEGATVYGGQYDPLRDCWKIGLEHPSLPAVPEGAFGPTVLPVIVINEVVMTARAIDDEGPADG